MSQPLYRFNYWGAPHRLSNLKWQLAEDYDNDRQSYMDGKVALCEEIYEKGLEALGCQCGLYLPFDK